MGVITGKCWTKGLSLPARFPPHGGQVAGKYLYLEELYHAAHNILGRQDL